VTAVPEEPAGATQAASKALGSGAEVKGVAAAHPALLVTLPGVAAAHSALVTLLVTLLVTRPLQTGWEPGV